MAGSAPIIMPPMTWLPVGRPPLLSVAGTARATPAPARLIIVFSRGIQNCWATCSWWPALQVMRATGSPKTSLTLGSRVTVWLR